MRRFFCGSPEHGLTRRGFLGTALAAGAGMHAASLLGTPALAEELRRQQKSCILLWLAGGASQLETFDPKPGAVTGGPFASIQTSTPGVRISELMPKMAARLKDTAIIRSLNTRNADHGSAAKIMMHGRMSEAGVDHPDLGAVLSRELGRPDSEVPDYVSFYFATEGRNMAPGSAELPRGPLRVEWICTTSMIPPRTSAGSKASPRSTTANGPSSAIGSARCSSRDARRALSTAIARHTSAVPASWPTSASSTSTASRSASAMRTARRCSASNASPPAGWWRRGCRSSASVGAGGTPIPRPSSRIRSWSPSSIT